MARTRPLPLMVPRWVEPTRLEVPLFAAVPSPFRPCPKSRPHITHVAHVAQGLTHSTSYEAITAERKQATL